MIQCSPISVNDVAEKFNCAHTLSPIQMEKLMKIAWRRRQKKPSHCNVTPYIAVSLLSFTLFYDYYFFFLFYWRVENNVSYVRSVQIKKKPRKCSTTTETKKKWWLLVIMLRALLLINYIKPYYSNITTRRKLLKLHETWIMMISFSFNIFALVSQHVENTNIRSILQLCPLASAMIQSILILVLEFILELECQFCI